MIKNRLLKNARKVDRFLIKYLNKQNLSLKFLPFIKINN